MQAVSSQIKNVVALRMARAAVGWSQEELAAQLGIAKTTIARMETLEGDISATQLAQLVNLCASAGVELQFMVGDEVRVRVNPQALLNAQARLLDTAFRRSDRVKPVGGLITARNAPSSSPRALARGLISADAEPTGGLLGTVRDQNKVSGNPVPSEARTGKGVGQRQPRLNPKIK